MLMKKRNLKKWVKKIKLQEERNILDNCLINPIVLQKVISESNLCKHAIREFSFANFDKDNYGSMFAKDVMELLAVISSQGHTGHSISYAIKLFNSLVKYDILAPLTLSDDEFEKDTKDPIDCDRQNIRKSSIFKKPDGTIIDIDAFTKMPTGTYHFDTKQWEENNSKICWTGSRLYEHKDNILTGRYFSKCAIKVNDNGTYTPKEKITIPCIEVEIDKGNWIMCVAENENRLKILNKQYNILWETEEKLKGINVTDCETLLKLNV